MAVKIRRSYKGASTSAVLSSAVTSATQTSISLSTSPSDWPTGKFFIVAAPGTAQEEKMCVTLSGSTLTVVSPTTASTSASSTGRGVDNTTARSTIASGSTVYPVFTAIDADEANELTSTYANQGGIVYQGASTFTQLGIGTAGQVLSVNSGATAPEWVSVSSATIPDSSITSAKIADGTIVNGDINASAAIALSKLATGALPTAITVASANIVDGTIATADLADSAVTSAKIADGTIAIGDLATAVANKLVPVGTIAMYGGATAPTGWLLCDGSAIDAGYTALKAIVGNNTPDLKGRFAIGDNASLSLLGTGGSTTIGTNNLPSHSHANTATASTSVSISDPGHEHTLDVSTTSGGIDGALFLDGGTIQSGFVNSATTGITATATTTVTMTNANTGGGEAYYPPYLVVNYIIKHD